MSANLDLDFIDYPTGWAIVRGHDLSHHPRCSFAQTAGALLCDCNALPVKWAELKGFSLDDERVARYLTVVDALPARDEPEPERCPTPCDDDCDAGCHEAHEVPVKRDHDPASCPGVQVTTPEDPSRAACAACDGSCGTCPYGAVTTPEDKR